MASLRIPHELEKNMIDTMNKLGIKSKSSFILFSIRNEIKRQKKITIDEYLNSLNESEIFYIKTKLKKIF